jgi:putative MFS transporter
LFVGTSICGAMPSFFWNIVMCFLMGLAAGGGMLPVANALLAEILPTKHRGWCLVLLGGIGTIGGYFATSESSALLQPFFGWRIMWLLGFPTGIILIALSPLLPESARFLVQMGRFKEAEAMLARYGSVIVSSSANSIANEKSVTAITGNNASSARSSLRPLLGLVVALTLAALGSGQFWSIAVASGKFNGDRAQHGPREHADCALRALCGSNDCFDDISLHCVEHQASAGGSNRRHNTGLVRDIARE